MTSDADYLKPSPDYLKVLPDYLQVLPDCVDDDDVTSGVTSVDKQRQTNDAGRAESLNAPVSSQYEHPQTKDEDQRSRYQPLTTSRRLQLVRSDTTYEEIADSDVPPPPPPRPGWLTVFSCHLAWSIVRLLLPKK